MLLHVILIIGPLCRLNARFLPLLYNRRHLGVTTFLIGLIHGIFNLIQFHALGNTDPITSLFTANLQYDSLVNFPFQVLGFFALLILFLMAATSHDFWLKNLSPKIWKGLHMMVYVAYSLLVMHVMLGAVQLEKSPVWMATVGLGVMTVIGLHLAAGWKGRKQDLMSTKMEEDGFHLVAELEEIGENCATTVLIDGENIALFKYAGKVSAVSNICRHQGGPLGEGQIVDGCITCPWHGYQYLPENGQSPPPFTEKLPTYDVKVIDRKVYVKPQPYPAGTHRPPALIPS
ncbi:MAG: Rieske 2Fe-2S domain-containing protein [Bacteroidota bacterium]